MVISAYAGQRLVPHETVVFIDEVQECDEALTFLKYLVQREDYDYIVSGSLLGVELEDLRSVPVGYLRVVDMYPLDFEEFCWANGVGKEAWAEVATAFNERRPVMKAIRERFARLHHWYLLVGGLPQAVSEFVATQNLARVHELHRDITQLYRRDISKYAPKDRRLVIKNIYDQIPAQLDSE